MVLIEMPSAAAMSAAGTALADHPQHLQLPIGELVDARLIRVHRIGLEGVQQALPDGVADEGAPGGV